MSAELHVSRRDRVRSWLVNSPDAVTDALQILKSVIATTAAWWLSTTVLDSQLPFLAPWTALLTVHATIYRSLRRGIETTIASAVGVGLSFLIGALLGVSLWTFALAILVGLAASRLVWIRDEGIAIATTAVFVLGSGFEAQVPMLGERLLAVGLGMAVGVTVNLLLIPPLRDQQAARYVDSVNRRMGDVLIDMADDLDRAWDTSNADAWIAQTFAIDQQIDSAWQSVRYARESAQLNPRRHVPTPSGPAPWRQQHLHSGHKVGYDEILTRVGEGVSHLRHLARTLRESIGAEAEWNEQFRHQWASIVRDTGHSIHDPDADVEPIYDRLNQLAKNFAGRDEPPVADLWPVYGSLITSVRHLAVIVDDVASARESREPAQRNPRV